MKDFKFTTTGYHEVEGTIWNNVENPKGLVQIIHDFKGHMLRYEKLIAYLSKQGYMVFGIDNLGHGRNFDADNKSYIFDFKLGKKEALLAHIETAKKMKKKFSLPIFLLGEGMGSFMARNIAINNDFKYSGYIFVGTSNKKSLLQAGGNSGLQRKLKNANDVIPKTNAKFWNSILENEKYNFKDKIDWYNSNPREIFLLSKDPFLQLEYSVSAINDIAFWMKESMDKSNIKKMDKRTPVLLLSGKEDPFNNGSVEKLYQLFSSVGIKKVKFKNYRGCLHDVFNESNYQDYFVDLVNWLDVFSL